MALSRLQLIGIILSFLWFLGIGSYQRNEDITKANQYAAWAYQTCMNTQAENKINDPQSCAYAIDQDLKRWLQDGWLTVAFISTVPILLAWLLGFVVIRTYRWVIKGK